MRYFLKIVQNEVYLLNYLLILVSFVLTGLTSWCGIVAYGLYGIRSRKQPLAVHLIHTRVFAQGAVVGALSLGVGYKIITEHFIPWLWPPKPSTNK